MPADKAHGLVNYARRVIILPPEARQSLVTKAVRFVERDGFLAIRYNALNYVLLRKLLRHLPTPMAKYYEWSGRFTPYRAQRITAYALSCLPRMYVLNSMGTGKTLASLWAMDWLMQERVIRSALVLTPLSTIDAVWADTVHEHLPHRKVGVLHASSKAKRLQRLQEAADIYIMNHDALRIPDLHEALMKRSDIDLLLVDEGAVFRDPKTRRHKALKELARHKQWVWWMTGTPMPNAPTDIWAQCAVVTPKTVPASFYRWRDMTMRKVTMFKWAPRKEAHKLCEDAMRPAVRFSLDDCTDLPPCVYEYRSVPLTADQKMAYSDLVTKMGAEIRGQRITPVNEGVKLGKLMQVCEGSVFDDDGGVVFLDYKSRKAELESIIEQAGGKVIVFASYVSTLKRLHRDIPDSLLVYGDTSRQEREAVFHKFQQVKNKYKVLIAQPGTMSHGLTLTSACVIVWFGVPRGNETYLQANARIHRPGQKKTTVVVHITSTKTEEQIYKRYKNQQGLQGLLLAAVREKIK